jgi:hypothetical protein
VGILEITERSPEILIAREQYYITLLDPGYNILKDLGNYPKHPVKSKMIPVTVVDMSNNVVMSFASMVEASMFWGISATTIRKH